MGFHAIGFDAIGTLFDFNVARKQATSALKDLLRERGCSAEDVEVTFATFHRLVEARMEDATTDESYAVKLAAVFVDAMLPSVRRRVDEREAASVMLSAHPAMPFFEDAAPALRRLEEGGWQCGILSNADDGWFSDTLSAGGPPWRCVMRVNGRRAKPLPDTFARFARELASPPGDIVYVGDDYTNDLVGALRAGMHALLIERTAARRDLSAVRDAYPDRLVGSAANLEEAVSLIETARGS